VREDIFRNVYKRLERQAANAREWRDVFNTFLFRLSGIPDGQGRQIYA
jgi:alpha-glucuronidase